MFTDVFLSLTVYHRLIFYSNSDDNGLYLSSTYYVQV